MYLFIALNLTKSQNFPLHRIVHLLRNNVAFLVSVGNDMYGLFLHLLA